MKNTATPTPAPDQTKRTKTYTVDAPRMLRWKLTPEDNTILKLSLMSWSSKHTELEKRRISLLKRMKGDFFLVLYAHGTPQNAVTSTCTCPKVEKPPKRAVKRDPLFEGIETSVERLQT
jgi:hypothetical protein